MSNRLFLFSIFVVVFITAFLFRGFNLDSPPYEQHMFRQTQTMSTVMDFARNGIDLLHPKVNWVGYPGYLVFEFPVFQAIGAMIYTKIGPHIAYIRLFNIFISFICGFFLFLLARKWFGTKVGLYSLFFFLLLPINIIYQRAILVDPFVVFLMVLSLWLLDNIFSKNKHAAINICILFVVLAIGLPIKALYFLPTFLFLAYSIIAKRPSIFLSSSIIFVSLSSAALLSLWLNHASSVNASYYFSSSSAVLQHMGISSILKPNYYGQLIWRLMNIIMMPMGVMLYLLSLLAIIMNKRNNINQNLIILITSIPFIYLFLFANINHPHSYYQLPLMPFFSISLAFGLNYITEKLDLSITIRRVITIIILVCFVISTLHIMVLNRYFFQEKDPTVFSERIKGLIEPNKYAMFLAGNVLDDRLASSFDANRKYKARGCEYLYAMDSFGLAQGFDSYNDAIQYFNDNFPHFMGHLDYVVFYDFPAKRPDLRLFNSIINKGYKIMFSNEQLLIFKKP